MYRTPESNVKYLKRNNTNLAFNADTICNLAKPVKNINQLGY
jgi:hypothetical protein